MQYPRLLLVPIVIGLIAAGLPALAASPEASSIALQDFNHNGKIDRALVTFANPSNAVWSVRGMTGLAVTYNGTPLVISDAFMASSGVSAVLEVVLDESDVHLPATTSAAGFEVTYQPVGASLGVSDGSTELAAIASGDTNAGNTEMDQAAPLLLSSDPATGSLKVVRTKDITLVFSEAVDMSTLTTSSELDPGGWTTTASADGRTVTVQHAPYGYERTETFGVSVKDMAGNSLGREGYPNPFTFRTYATTDPANPEPQVDTIFALVTPRQLDTLKAGEANILSWYSNQAELTDVRLSYSANDGQTYVVMATVPASQRTYVWYPTTTGSAFRLKAEGYSANGALVNVTAVGPLSVTANANPTPLHTVSSIDVTMPTESSATVSVRLDRPPSSATFSCNSGTLTAPVLVTGDRPVRLEANLSGLAVGVSYSCSFHLTDAQAPALDLAVPAFTGGFDTMAPQLIGPAVIDQFDAAAGTARLTWTTNEASTATVSYGAYLNYGGHAADANLTTTHSLTLIGLTPGAMHQARITSIDAKGNAAVSLDYYFVFLREGDLVKGSASAVYWYKGGARHAFPHIDVYRSWFGEDFSKVIRLPETQLGTITLAGNVTMKEGVYLVKIQTDPKTYAVEPNGVLRWIQTEAQARTLYGTAWAARVRDIDVSLFTDYTIGAALQDGVKPAGYVN